MGAFLFGRYSESHVEKEVKMNHTEMYSEDLDSFCRELSNGGLEIVVSNPSGSFGDLFCVVCSQWKSNPAVDTN